MSNNLMPPLVGPDTKDGRTRIRVFSRRDLRFKVFYPRTLEILTILQRKLQRQQFLLNYLKAGDRTPNLPHNSPALYQLSFLGDGQQICVKEIILKYVLIFSHLALNS